MPPLINEWIQYIYTQIFFFFWGGWGRGSSTRLPPLDAPLVRSYHGQWIQQPQTSIHPVTIKSQLLFSQNSSCWRKPSEVVRQTDKWQLYVTRPAGHIYSVNFSQSWEPGNYFAKSGSLYHLCVKSSQNMHSKPYLLQIGSYLVYRVIKDIRGQILNVKNMIW